MTNVEIVQTVTRAFVENRRDQEVLDTYFAPDFEHTANGVRSDLQGYASHLNGYMERYEHLSIPSWDELFAAEDKVVAAYTLKARTEEGREEDLAVMAV